MPVKTEKEKMLSGELYLTMDPELDDDRNRAHTLINLYNQTVHQTKRREILITLFAQFNENSMIESPFYCAYGYNIHVGSNVYINFGCVFLDCNRIEIGDNTLIGPYVQIYTPNHTTNPQIRLSRQELSAPIKIGNNVWIGGGAIICPGVTIGDNTTIGAGSVVTKNVPANVVAAGNPCQVIKELEV